MLPGALGQGTEEVKKGEVSGSAGGEMGRQRQSCSVAWQWRAPPPPPAPRHGQRHPCLSHNGDANPSTPPAGPPETTEPSSATFLHVLSQLALTDREEISIKHKSMLQSEWDHVKKRNKGVLLHGADSEIMKLN